MQQYLLGNEIVVGTIIDETGTIEKYKANEDFDKIMIDDISRTLSMVFKVHSSLDLSLSKCLRKFKDNKKKITGKRVRP